MSKGATQVVEVQDEGPDPKDEAPQAGEEETTDQASDGMDSAAFEAELKRARREAAKFRTELRALQEADETRKREEMGDLEKTQADLAAAKVAQAAAEAESRERLISSALINAAAKANFSDPADAVKLIAAREFEIADDGAVIDADKAIEALAKEKPYLLKKASAAAASPTNAARDVGTRSDDDMRTLVYGDAGNDSLWEGGVRGIGGK